MLHIVIGEQVPKTLAIRLPEATSLWIALPLYVFYWVAFPAIWLLNRSANACLRLIGIRPASEHELAHSEEELRLLLASHQACRLPDEKRDLLDNVFELSERIARQVMVPRADVVYLSTTRALDDENLALARRAATPASRSATATSTGSSASSTSRTSSAPSGRRTTCAAIARPVPFVPETTPLDKLLARMPASGSTSPRCSTSTAASPAS